MNIEHISCTQFAGIKDRDITFNKGINLIYGKNESGKSTLVNLIYNTLFQNVKIDKRKDKAFVENFFPATQKNVSLTGDFIDGSITFTTDSGTFSLSKEWGDEPRCMLSTPTGDKIRDQKKITAILNNELSYGSGVYSEMLLSSQVQASKSLESILNPSNKSLAKQEISDVLSKAFLESGGISVDEIGEAIEKKISDIEGKHWDRIRSIPEAKAGKWLRDLGEILPLYYDMDQADKCRDTAEKAQHDADLKTELLKSAESELTSAENKLNEYNRYFELILSANSYKKEYDSVSKELERLKTVLMDWPKRSNDLKKANELSEEKQIAQLLQKYNSVKKLMDEKSDFDKKLQGRVCPTDAEISQAKKAEREITKLENKLGGMNLNAAIEMFGENTVQVRSLRTQKPVDVSNGSAALTETVEITIPGVMRMVLSPQDVNIEEITEKVSEQTQKRAAIFEKYNVSSIDELERCADEIRSLNNKIDLYNERLKVQLGSDSYEELQLKAAAITTAVRPIDAVNDDIVIFCNGKELSRFIAESETIIAGYNNDHNSIPELENKVIELDARKSELVKMLSDIGIIPPEYTSVKDPVVYRKKLETSIEEKRTARDNAYKEKTASLLKAEEYSLSDLQERYESAKRDFEEKKTLLAHWLHIKAVYDKLKESVDNNPFKDIERSFTHYMSVISNGRVTSEMPQPGKFELTVYSNDSIIDYSKLSEGTKETVSLAFRLAVLDHLFPNGGGIIVFDDPFANMDNERTAQSCDLIKECAKKHQVIFLTCNYDYIDMLNAEPITIHQFPSFNEIKK